MAPDLIDYNMPENGVFHNLILAKMDVHYPGHAQQFMHAFWGVGQMSFVKHAIFVGKDAPELNDYEALVTHVLNRLHPAKILISHGVVDHLDHSSPRQFVGGKLGIDATDGEVGEGVELLLSDAEMLAMIRKINPNVTALRQYFTQTQNPVTIVTVNKQRSQQYLISELAVLKPYIKVLIIVDEDGNDLDNPYMLIWRVVNNIDAGRDVVLEPFIAVDASNKDTRDGYDREWPGDTLCSRDVLDRLQAKGVIDIDEAFIEKWGLL
jgi:4-hydroxy-3-polyprenylbenzoate decarboxylase